MWATPVRKDNAELRRKLDVAIECMKRDGTMAKMHEKWFGTKPAPGSAAATIYPGYGVPDMPRLRSDAARAGLLVTRRPTAAAII